MSTPIYHPTNYRKNIVDYWQQFYPNYEIPKGYQVHHIKPRCTFEDRDDPAIHHPRNLIALHPEDHVAIHKHRGDKVSGAFMLSVVGRVVTDVTKAKISKSSKGQDLVVKRKISTALSGRKLSEEHKNNLREVRKLQKPYKHTEESKAKMSAAKKGISYGLTSDETKAKISVALKGKPGPMKGKTHSAETKEKIRQASVGRKHSAESKLKMSIARRERDLK